MKKTAVLSLYYLSVTGLRWTLTLPCPLSAEALEVGKGLAVSAGEAGFEFVSDSEISAWLQTELRGRERKCIPLEDLVKCLG